MKRISRKLSQETKQKIAAAKRGQKFTEEHKANLSNALKKYWETIPSSSQLVNSNNNMKIGNQNNKDNYENK